MLDLRRIFLSGNSAGKRREDEKLMARTTSTLVQGVLVNDYGPDYQDNYPSLDPYIDTASAIVDRVAACAIDRDMTLSSTELEILERWLAAHCYTQMDQTFASPSTEGASASFHGQTGMGFEGSKYGQMALRLDWSGCLQIIDKRQFAGGIWLGKPVSEQTPYDSRD